MLGVRLGDVGECWELGWEMLEIVGSYVGSYVGRYWKMVGVICVFVDTEVAPT